MAQQEGKINVTKEKGFEGYISRLLDEIKQQNELLNKVDENKKKIYDNTSIETYKIKKRIEVIEKKISLSIQEAFRISIKTRINSEINPSDKIKKEMEDDSKGKEMLYEHYRNSITGIKENSNVVDDYGKFSEKKSKITEYLYKNKNDLNEIRRYIKEELGEKIYNYVENISPVENASTKSLVSNALYFARQIDLNINLLDEEQKNIEELANEEVTIFDVSMNDITYNPYENDIDELLNNTSDEKDKEALNYAKDNLEYVKEKYTEKVLDFALGDSMPQSIPTRYTEKMVDNSKNNIVVDSFELTMNGYASKVDHIDDENLEIHFNDKTKESIEGIFKIFDENNFITEKNMHIAEDNYKRYAFLNYFNAKEKLVEAIKNKDLSNITNITNDFKKEKEIADKLYELGDAFSHDNKSYPTNVDLARVKEFDPKLRMNYQTVSLVNSLLITKKLLMINSISTQEYINNPYKTLSKIGDKLIEKCNNTYYKNNFNDFVSNTIRLNPAMLKENQELALFLRSVEGIHGLCPGNEEQNMVYKRYLELSKVNSVNNVTADYFYLFSKQKFDITAKNIIVGYKPNNVGSIYNLSGNEKYRFNPNTLKFSPMLDTKKALEEGNIEANELISRAKNLSKEILDIKPELFRQCLSGIDNLSNEIQSITRFSEEDKIEFNNLKESIYNEHRNNALEEINRNFDSIENSFILDKDEVINEIKEAMLSGEEKNVNQAILNATFKLTACNFIGTGKIGSSVDGIAFYEKYDDVVGKTLDSMCKVANSIYKLSIVENSIEENEIEFKKVYSSSITTNEINRDLARENSKPSLKEQYEKIISYKGDKLKDRIAYRNEFATNILKDVFDKDEMLIKGVALLSIIKEKHNSRGFFFKIFNRSKYKLEEKGIKNITEKIKEAFPGFDIDSEIANPPRYEINKAINESYPEMKKENNPIVDKKEPIIVQLSDDKVEEKAVDKEETETLAEVKNNEKEDVSLQ